jgi:hypothetical protein
MKYWSILSWILYTPQCCLISIELTIKNAISASVFDNRVGWINPWSFRAVFTSPHYEDSGTWRLLSLSRSDSMSAMQKASHSRGLSMSLSQISQSSVSKIHASAQSSSLVTGWQLIRWIQQTLIILVLSQRWEIQRYLGIMKGDSWWCRRNCVTERRTSWKTRKEGRDGGGII